MLTFASITGSFLGVVVGKEGHRESFFLHEKLFTSHSDFLKRAAKEEWLHQKNVILLPEDDPITFRLYAVLTYTGFLTTKDLPSEWQSLVDIYVLAEKLQDTWAKNHIIDAMHSFVAEKLPRNPASWVRMERIDGCVSTASLIKLYEGTPSDSQARELVVDLFADNGTAEWLALAGDLLPHEFLFEVTVRLLQKRPCVVIGNMLDRPSSHYYEKVMEQRGPVGEDLEDATTKSGDGPLAPTDRPGDGNSATSKASAPSLFGGKTTLTSNVRAVPNVSVTA